MLEATVPWWSVLIACIATEIGCGIIRRAAEERAYIRGFNDGVKVGLHLNDDEEGEDDE